LRPTAALGEFDVTDHHAGTTSRRGFLKHASAGAGLGLGALLAGCTGGANGPAGDGKRTRLKAAFSNGGLRTSWCKLGHDTVMLWADLLDVDVVWIDGQLNPEKQRNAIDLKIDGDWDFCSFQALQINTLQEPTERLKERGIPLISMDTLLVPEEQLREAGVWVQVAADHTELARQSTRVLMDKIGGKGKVIHIGGANAHSGARDRDAGFREVIGDYPEVSVVGGSVRWCDWKPEKARNTFESLLQQSKEPIAGAFFHNDDMALACTPALKKNSPHEGMVMTAVDGQKKGLAAVRDGVLAATSVNPTCMIHMMALVVGQFIVRNGETIDDVPLHIPLPGPLVTKEAGNIEAMFYLSDPKHCLV